MTLKEDSIYNFWYKCILIYNIVKLSCCGLSSTGLNNIDANEFTSDNISVFSILNVSGYSFNKILVENSSTFNHH